MAKKVVSIICGLLISSKFIYCEETDLIITASRLPWTRDKLVRSIETIDKEEIKKYALNSLPEIVKFSANTDIQQRGVNGIQSDISIRGSTFNQVLFLLNGMRMNDPQTAHHNFDLPIPIEDIEKVEILSGPASVIYGTDAFAGAINIITRKPIKNSISANLSSGEFATQSGAVNAETVWQGVANKISVERSKSSGFVYDRDYDYLNFLNQTNFGFLSGNSELLLGYVNKDFGAYDFYTPKRNFPSRETTKTELISFNWQRQINKIELNPKVYFRRHKDKFVLDLNRPSWYTNEHTTMVYGIDLPFNMSVNKWLAIAGGIESFAESIESTRLGIHYRSRYSVYTEAKSEFGKNIISSVGLRTDFHSDYGTVVSPGLAIGYRIIPQIKLRSSVGYGFRAPSYTDLYYSDMVNLGNPDLLPEQNWSYEIGLDWDPNKEIQLTTTLFRRDETNLIDWIMRPGTTVYKAENIRQVNMTGVESGIFWKPFTITTIKLGYTYLNGNLVPVIEGKAKYSLRYPRNSLNLGIIQNLPFETTVSLQMAYKERINEQGYSIIDMKIGKQFKNFGFYVKGNNLGNAIYEEVLGVSIPGRWFSTGIDIRF